MAKAFLSGFPEGQHLPQRIVLTDKVMPQRAADMQYQQYQ